MIERYRPNVKSLQPCAASVALSNQTGADLPANTVPYAEQALSDVLAGKRLRLFGWPDPFEM
jgi:hypothetical protein